MMAGNLGREPRGVLRPLCVLTARCIDISRRSMSITCLLSISDLQDGQDPGNGQIEIWL